GFGRAISSSNASIESRTLRAVQATFATAHASCPASDATWRARFAGRVIAGRIGEEACGCFLAIVHCTPVGMQGGPDPGGNPLPDDMSLDGVTVMDTVYAPRETPLLRESRSCGARTVDGWQMFERQARLQSERWPVG
ncbi:MAG: hypothetical protein ACKOFI_05695, partial [Phycisphaerales bacterium]